MKKWFCAFQQKRAQNDSDCKQIVAMEIEHLTFVQNRV